MENLNNLFESYKDLLNNNEFEDAEKVQEEINKLGYDIEFEDEECSIPKQLVKIEEENNKVKENNKNNEEEVVMENKAVIRSSNIESIVEEIFMPLVSMELISEQSIKIDMNNNIIYFDYTNVNFKILAVIARELSFRKDRMPETYEILTVDYFNYNKVYTSAKTDVYPAYNENQMEILDDVLEGMQKVIFDAYDAKKKTTCRHYVIFDLQTGQKATLKKTVTRTLKAGKIINKGIDTVDNILTVGTIGIKQFGKLGKTTGKTTGALVETAASFALSGASEIANSLTNIAVNIVEGKYVDPKTARNTKANLAKLNEFRKHFFNDEDEENTKIENLI